MTQRILIEVLLFLIPFAVFLVYRAASRDLRVRDRWPLTRLVIIGGVIAVLGLILPALLQPRETEKCYDPVRYDAEGRIVPPKEIDCAQVALPGSDTQTTTPAQTPVAPRDTGN
jgi:hypothetical protein